MKFPFPPFTADPVYAKGEVFAYVGLPQNLKDLKGEGEKRTMAASPKSRSMFPCACAEGEQIVFLNCLELCRKSPDSGKRQYRSRTWKRRFDPGLRAGNLGVSRALALRPMCQR